MERLVSMLRTEIPPGTCLEIGIGTGRIALPLADAGVSIVGIDISREMLRRLMSKAGTNPPPVAVADATRLPFRDASFDSAIASHVFHLIPRWTTAIDELARVLKPGGLIFAARGGRRPDEWARELIRRFYAEAGESPGVPGADKIEEVDEHMLARGATVRELPTLSVETSSSVNDLLENLEAGYWSACWSLDEATRKRAAIVARAWAEAALGDLDEQRPHSELTIWHTYELGQQR
ncbi:MAG: class I SAM-dependent methyltransferase [Candidatus Dormiibacterota bacterium]